jgi:MoxR-like ATPase
MQPLQLTGVNHIADGSIGVPLRELALQMRALRDRVVAEVGQVVVGMEAVTHQFLIALLAGGHVLLEGVPGVAKTTLSKTFARVLGTQYQRLQFTPDLLPSDVTGTYIFDRKQNEFVLRRGPLFCQVLLADEVNRAPAKTQSALLEAMQENQVTIEGTTLPLPRPFMVLATQNPIEQEGVYRLPEAQLDRFLLRVEMGYPGRKGEVAMLKLHSHPTREVGQLFTADQILDIQDRVTQVHGDAGLFEYIVELAEASRVHPDVALGASPRASLCLLRCARARAMLDGRHYFTHEDVHGVAPGVLGHRLIIRPEAEVEGKRSLDVVRDLIDSVPVLTGR